MCTSLIPRLSPKRTVSEKSCAEAWNRGYVCTILLEAWGIVNFFVCGGKGGRESSELIFFSRSISFVSSSSSQAFLSPLQGFLNSIVYGWSRREFRKAVSVRPGARASPNQYESLNTSRNPGIRSSTLIFSSNQHTHTGRRK